MRLLAAADRVDAPWKNGGGITREIAAWPPHAGFDDFDWRISQADVKAPGPFSRFEGIDRILTVLEGRLALTVDGKATPALTPQSAPFAFAGEAQVSGVPEGDPVADLNLMVRRGRFIGQVVRLGAGDWRLDATANLLFALWPTTVCIGAERNALKPRDALLRDDGPAVDLTISAPALLISLTRL